VRWRATRPALSTAPHEDASSFAEVC